jgi:hypothetical protein
MCEAKMLLRCGAPTLSRAYRLKAKLCIFLGLYTPAVMIAAPEKVVAIGTVKMESRYHPENHTLVTVSAMRVLSVGKGLLSNWWYDVYWQENVITTGKHREPSMPNLCYQPEYLENRC